MEVEERKTPQKGDWVRVWAVVADPGPHPEEYKVRFESHNEHYLALVRRDHVEFSPGEVPDFAPRCSSMWCVDAARDCYVRCYLPHEHPGPHFVSPEGIDYRWTRSSGYFEEES